jgi:ribosomal protein L3 glutamine methyltransferase
MEAPIDELLTPRDWLRWSISRFNEANLFFGHGCDNARDEAAWLINHVLHLPLDQFDQFQDTRLTRSERQALFNLINQRVTRRIPAAYLTNSAWLGSFRFYVDERVIVPRSYFAELLDEALSPWLDNPDEVRSALDLCTGSGCLAIIMAHTFPQAAIDAVDLSPDALAVARRNVDDYGLAEQVELIESDLFSALTDRQYDLIISNPPYVTAESMQQLPTEYRHEPEMALAAGDDGLDIVRRMLAQAAAHLTADGLLMVEVGHNADLVEEAFPHVPFTWIDTVSSESKIFMLSRSQLQDYFK